MALFNFSWRLSVLLSLGIEDNVESKDLQEASAFWNLLKFSLARRILLSKEKLHTLKITEALPKYFLSWLERTNLFEYNAIFLRIKRKMNNTFKCQHSLVNHSYSEYTSKSMK